MPTVHNKTSRPLRLNLPGGKTLHLPAAGEGKIAPEAATAASVLRLVESGEIEVLDDRARRRGGHAKGGRFHESRGHLQPRGSTTRGDR